MVEIAELGGQRMQDNATRLVGLDGLVVTGVQRTGGRLDLEVELCERAASCRHCGGVEVCVKERPRAFVRDLPIAGTVTRLVWRKRATGAATVGARSPRPTSNCRRVSA